MVTPGALEAKESAAEGRLLCDVGLYYGASASNTATYPEVAGRAFGLKLYLDHTTGDLKVDELEAVREVMRAWPAGKPLLVHAEDRTVAMMLGLMAHVGRGVHFCHVSRKVEIEIGTHGELPGRLLVDDPRPARRLCRDDGRVARVPAQRQRQ